MSHRDFEELLMMGKQLRDALELTRLQHAQSDVSPLPSKPS